MIKFLGVVGLLILAYILLVVIFPKTETKDNT